MRWQEFLVARDFINSSRGKRIYFEDPSRSEWTWEDMARGLSNECRYAGQCLPYTVAEHSYKVSWVLQKRGHGPRVVLAGHVHDGPEGLGLRDLARPLKRMGAFGFYRDLEALWQRAVLDRAGLLEMHGELPQVVHDVDTEILATEVRHVHPNVEIEDLPAPMPELGGMTWGWSAAEAQERWIVRLQGLMEAVMLEYRPDPLEFGGGAGI